MTTAGPQLPHMEVFDRVLTLPVIERALSKSAATYTRVKDSHQLLNWVLTTAESSLSHATKQAVPIAAPIARKLESPIHYVDHTLCMGLDKIEEKVPMVKEKPEQILENAYMLAIQTMQPAVTRIALVNAIILTHATSLRDISWNKANQILDTRYGCVAIKGLDSTAVVVDKLIDKYFPATGEEEQSVPGSTDEHDKLLHTLQMVGRLSNKAARRVYTNVVYHLRTINKDNFRTYMGSLVEFLQVARYIHSVNKITNSEPTLKIKQPEPEPEPKAQSKAQQKSQQKAQQKGQAKSQPKTQPKVEENNKKEN